MAKFKDKLLAAAAANRSWLCVGLDPDLDKLPAGIEKSCRGAGEFIKSIIDATRKYVCAYKPNSAFYEQFGAEGISLLKDVIAHVPDDIPVILDAKRGDIGNTSRKYAMYAFDYLNAGAVTVNPYMGHDSLKPFLEYEDRGVFVLCLTSNPSSADFQKAMIERKDQSVVPLYETVVEKALGWNEHDNIGFVVGATVAEELGRIRNLAGEDVPILIPGIGAQGGDLEMSLKMGGNREGKLAIINAARSVLYAGKGKDYAEKAETAARELVEKMRGIGG